MPESEIEITEGDTLFALEYELQRAVTPEEYHSFLMRLSKEKTNWIRKEAKRQALKIRMESRTNGATRMAAQENA